MIEHIGVPHVEAWSNMLLPLPLDHFLPSKFKRVILETQAYSCNKMRDECESRKGGTPTKDEAAGFLKPTEPLIRQDNHEKNMVRL